jgi:hypothetical protein
VLLPALSRTSNTPEKLSCLYIYSWTMKMARSHCVMGVHNPSLLLQYPCNDTVHPLIDRSRIAERRQRIK